MAKYKVMITIQEEGKSIFSNNSKSIKGLRKCIISDLTSEKIADDILDHIQDNYIFEKKSL